MASLLGAQLALGCADQAYRERRCQAEYDRCLQQALDSDGLEQCLALRSACYSRASARARSSAVTGATSASAIFF